MYRDNGSPYTMVELIDGPHGGQQVAVYPGSDGDLPRRIVVGEEPYVRFNRTKVYFPEHEGDHRDKPDRTPLTLPVVRRPRFIRFAE